MAAAVLLFTSVDLVTEANTIVRANVPGFDVSALYEQPDGATKKALGVDASMRLVSNAIVYGGRPQ